jgi:hypothetical protein
MSLYQNKEIVRFTLFPNFSDARKWKGNFTADRHYALRCRLHLHFGCAVWMCVSPLHACSMSFSVSKTKK